MSAPGPTRRGPTGRLAFTLVAGTLTLTAAGVAPGAAPAGAADRVVVVVAAAENFWGSIARQLGGVHASVTSIITNPNTDPHAYEPTAQNGRTIASAKLVIENGAGYDPWAAQLLASNPSPSQRVLDVGNLVHVGAGGNPHRWYDPADVHQVIAATTAAFEKIDPADRAYFAQRRVAFDDQGLATYTRLISEIRARYANTPIGASESIVAPLARALGLRVLTPYPFLKAISEGSEPTAADKSAIDRQIATRRIKIYVYNSQNATPDVQAQVNAARARGIPVTTVTETLAPAGATFQAWQVKELRGIERALAAASHPSGAR